MNVSSFHFALPSPLTECDLASPHAAAVYLVHLMSPISCRWSNQITPFPSLFHSTSLHGQRLFLSLLQRCLLDFLLYSTILLSNLQIGLPPPIPGGYVTWVPGLEPFTGYTHYWLALRSASVASVTENFQTFISIPVLSVIKLDSHGL